MKKLFFIALLSLSFGLQAQQDAAQSGIHVEGEGVVKVVPDEVEISSRVEHEGNSAAEVQRKTDAVIDQIIKYLKSQGISEKNIRTDYVNLNKRYNYNDKTYSYVAAQSLSIRLEDISKYEEIIEGLLQNGLNGINGVQFKSSELKKYQAQAREKAVLDAKQKAQELAAPLNLKLGNAYYINENSGNSYQPVYRMAELKMSDASESSESLAPGEMEVSVKVQVAFQLYFQ